VSALDRFSAPTRAWFRSTFDAPTPAQEQGWDAISQGAHTLILAPTGSGKTLAAFLWAIDRLVSAPPPEPGQQLRVLYVSPLKALTYDVERNLRAPLAGIALESTRRGLAAPSIAVGSRTGDTPAAERRALGRRAPDILVTTPESLYLMLTSAVRETLTSVEAVIVDEVHAVAATKRGTHLALCLERLTRLCDRSPQRIGLSATQKPLDEVARFLGGRQCSAAGQWGPRPVTVVDTGVGKPLDLQVLVPVDDMAQLGKPILGDDGEAILSGPAAGDPEARHSIWPAIHPLILDLIRRHRSTLIFVNSRRLAERLANRLNDLTEEDEEDPDDVDQTQSDRGGVGVPAASGGRGPKDPGARHHETVRAHHGSVAREQRLDIEDLLKSGRLPALVATSSLELGIDMGAIDLVVQVAAPPSVASGLQRVGRAGHQVGKASVGRIIPKFRGDLVSAAVVAMGMKRAAIESTVVPRNPLDVLAQQIVAMCVTEDLSVDEVAEMVAGAYPFADCSRALLEGVIDMLAGRYPSDAFAELRPRLNWDRVAGTLTARPGSRMVAVTNGGTIPDRGLFGVFTPPPNGHRVGELDEEMVYECRVGETFVLGASTWRIVEITRDRVLVVPAPGEVGKTPFWHGDNPGRPVELGRAIGAFLREVAGWTDERLAADCCLDPSALRNLRAYLADEEAATGALPTDRQIVIQRFRDELGDWRLCILSPFGGRVHAPWALAVEAKLRNERGFAVQTMWSDDGLVIRLPEADDAPDIDSVLPLPDEVEDLVVGELATSGLFASRFRENAARALLLPRRRPGQRTPLWQQRQRSADLLAVASQHGQFPILLETYRECLRDVFDMPALREILAGIAERRLAVVAVDTMVASPFASSLANAYVANFLYEGDAPLAERRAQALTLDRELLGELLGTEELRELIQPAALDALEIDLQCLEPRLWARTADEAWDLLRRLGDLTAAELAARSTGDFGPVLLEARRAVEVKVGGEVRLIAAQDAGRYRDGLGTQPPPGLPDAFLARVDNPAGSILARWARTHGPFTSAQPAARFGLPVGVVESLCATRVATGTLLTGDFRPGGTTREWCDPDVLRSLRQRSLAVLRREIEPVDAPALGRFLPDWQGVASPQRGVERLLDVVRQLQGVPIAASVLERDVLASRVADYAPRQLDELVAAGEVIWLGAGALGRDDGKVILLLAETASSLRPVPVQTESPAVVGHEHDRIRDVLERRGACFFRDLAGSDDRVTIEALWDLVWGGEVTNDSLAALRSFTGHAGPAARSRPAGRSSRSRAARSRPRPGAFTIVGPPRAQGRWALVERELGGVTNPTQRVGVLAEALLERHGVLTREAVRGEGHPGGFAGLYPVLRAMEESGHARRGYFVAGMGGAQFALAGAVDRLRSRPAEGSRTVVLAATDPANAYGVSLPWPQPATGKSVATHEAAPKVSSPRRVPGAYVVLVDGAACLYLEKGGKGLVRLADLDANWEAPAIEALGQLVASGRVRRLTLARYDEALAPLLLASGFIPSPRGLVRYA